jgi:hypothetical protein
MFLNEKPPLCIIESRWACFRVNIVEVSGL